MKLTDKTKEIADVWLAWGKAYEELNKELIKARPSASYVNGKITEVRKLRAKRSRLYDELNVLLEKNDVHFKALLKEKFGVDLSKED